LNIFYVKRVSPVFRATKKKAAKPRYTNTGRAYSQYCKIRLQKPPCTPGRFKAEPPNRVFGAENLHFLLFWGFQVIFETLRLFFLLVGVKKGFYWQLFLLLRGGFCCGCHKGERFDGACGEVCHGW
jgi:hypothetical protein